jgi:hypothetical protein
MRRSWIALIVLASAFCLIAGVAVAAADEVPPASEAVPPASEEGVLAPLDESCNSGHVCVWTEKSYQGAKGESLCTGGVHTLAGMKFSAKNRCANKASWLRRNGEVTACLNPGDNVPIPFEFNELWIGAEGSRC